MLRILAYMWKNYHKKKKESGAPPPPDVVDQMRRDLSKYLSKISSSLKRRGIHWRYYGTSPYAELYDIEEHPEEEEIVRGVAKELCYSYPLAGRLAYKLLKEGLIDEKTARSIAGEVGWAIDAIAFLEKIEHEDELLANPHIFKKIVNVMERLSKGKPAKVDDFIFSDPVELRSVVPVLISDLARKDIKDREKIEAFKKAYEAILKYLERHPELKQFAREVEAEVAKSAVRELKPPKAVNIILSKLEAAKEQAQWMGAVDIRAVKKILYDVQDRKKIVEEAFRLVKEWEKGNKEAFFEKYMHLKDLPEADLEDLGLVGDLERLRRRVATGSLTPVDAVNILAALYTVYSMAESYLVKFLSRVEEHGLPRIEPEKLEKHVIKPLKERLRRIRPIVRGDFEI